MTPLPRKPGDVLILPTLRPSPFPLRALSLELLAASTSQQAGPGAWFQFGKLQCRKEARGWQEGRV